MVRSWSSPRDVTVGGLDCVMLSWAIGNCVLYVYVAKNEPVVLVDQGDLPPREADILEVEALAERFGSAELKDALKRMQAQY